MITSLELGTDLATATEIALADYCRGFVETPASTPMEELTFYGAPTLGGRYYLIYLEGERLPFPIVPGQRQPLPLDLFGVIGLKIVGNVSGQILLGLDEDLGLE